MGVEQCFTRSSLLCPICMLLIDPCTTFSLVLQNVCCMYGMTITFLIFQIKSICEQIQSKIHNMHIPTYIGRIPRKVEMAVSKTRNETSNQKQNKNGKGSLSMLSACMLH